MFEWTKGSAYTAICTLYASNITLNNNAAYYLDEVRWCQIGIDSKSLLVAIKPVTKEEIDLKLVNLNHIHKISHGKGYLRISNKAVIDDISKLLKKPLNGEKFTVNYDEVNKMLIVDLNKQL